MTDTRIQLDTWINLPRLGKEAFKELMKAGVEYTTGRGFFIRSNIDLKAAKQVISAAAGGDVFFIFRCYICGNETTCADCSYRSVCSVEQVGGRCICLKCSREDLGTYAKKWSSTLGRP